jgi:hypothetical protein
VDIAIYQYTDISLDLFFEAIGNQTEIYILSFILAAKRQGWNVTRYTIEIIFNKSNLPEKILGRKYKLIV